MLERVVERYREVHGRRPRGLPKYLRVCEAIEREIAAGGLAPGDKLPSETELAGVLPASLGTVQKALGTLAGRGVLVRRHGRGTFVSPSRVASRYLWHLRFLGDAGELLPVWVKVHAVERVEGAGPWRDFLGVHPWYLRVRRTLDVNHEFTALGEFVVPGPPYRALLDLAPADLDGVSLRDCLLDRFGVRTLRVGEQIGCDAAPPAVCRILGLAPGAVALVCHILGYGLRDAPVYFQRCHVPPNRRRLEVRERQP